MESLLDELELLINKLCVQAKYISNIIECEYLFVESKDDCDFTYFVIAHYLTCEKIKEMVKELKQKKNEKEYFELNLD